MARSGLFQNKKFKRLVALLGIPRPQVVGLLETMWHACYESGNPVFAELSEIEAAAEWWGEPAVFANAAIKARMVDQNDDGTFQVHDFWDHAPKGTSLRRDREQARKALRTCLDCNGEFYSLDHRAKFCSDACRQRNYRNRPSERVTERVTFVTDRYTTPDTRHPTPDTLNTKPSSSRARTREAGSPDPAARRLGPSGKGEIRPNGDEGGEIHRANGDEPGMTMAGTGERRRARGPNGDEALHPAEGLASRENVGEDDGGDDADGCRLDREIRAFIGAHRMLTYDLRTHGQVRKLVEIAGWPRAKELISQGVRSGARFPAGWAVGVLANEEQSLAARGGANGRSPPAISPADARVQATLNAAIAKNAENQ